MPYDAGGTRFSPSVAPTAGGGFADFLAGAERGIDHGTALRGLRKKRPTSKPAPTFAGKRPSSKPVPQADFTDYLAATNPFLATGRTPY